MSSLIAKLGLDSAQFKAGLQSAAGDARTFGSAISQVGSTLGIAFSGAALAGMAKSIIADADAIQQASKNFGVVVESLQALRAAAKMANIEGDALDGMLNKLTSSAADAASGNEKTAAAFAALGISIGDVASLSPDELLERIGRALATGGTTADETAAAFDILGRSTGQYIDFLKQLGTDGLDPTIARMKELGVVMTEETVSSLAKAADSWDMFATGVKATVANLYSSIVDGVSDAIAAAMQGVDVFEARAMRIENERMVAAKNAQDKAVTDAAAAAEKKAAAEQVFADKAAAIAAKEAEKKKKEQDDFDKADKAAAEKVRRRFEEVEKDRNEYLMRENAKAVEDKQKADDKIAEQEKKKADILSGAGVVGNAPAMTSFEKVGASFGGGSVAALREVDRQLQVAKSMESYLKQIEENTKINVAGYV